MDGCVGRRVLVVGAGVVGLTAALELVDRGARVRILADQIEASDSAVAAALWAVPYVERSERVRAWAYTTLARLRRDASAEHGVREQECRVVGIAPAVADPWTRGFTPAIRAATPAELPPGSAVGTVSSIPLIDTSRFLPSLRARCVAAGVTIERARVDDLAAFTTSGELDSDEIVVVAAGAGAPALVDDAEGSVLRSQVVRMTNPGLTQTLIVRDGDAAPLTIVPRFDDVVVVGGGDDRYDPAVDRDETAAMIARARRVEPLLGDAETISAAVGHRPLRPRIRVAADRIGAARVVHCYGHGGAGIALSWGTAATVADLVAAGEAA